MATSTSGLIRAYPPLQDQIDHLVARSVSLAGQMAEVNSRISPEAIKHLVDMTDRVEVNRLEKLRDDIVLLCQLLVAKGLVTQEELNEVIR
jgi:hypothetical protein